MAGKLKTLRHYAAPTSHVVIETRPMVGDTERGGYDDGRRAPEDPSGAACRVGMWNRIPISKVLGEEDGISTGKTCLLACLVHKVLKDCMAPAQYIPLKSTVA